MAEAQDLIVIGGYPNSGEANLARNRLIDAGIPAEIADDITADWNWDLIGAIHNVKLLVPSDRADEARAELAAKVSLAELEFSARQTVEQPDVDDPPEVEPTDREKRARRAFIGSIAGLAFWPLQFYVFWVLIQVYVSNEPLGSQYRRRAWIAFAFNVPIVLIQCLYLRMLWRELNDLVF